MDFLFLLSKQFYYIITFFICQYFFWFFCSFFEWHPLVKKSYYLIRYSNGIYNQVLNNIIGEDISSKAKLLSMFQELNIAKREYDQIKSALKMVKQTGYGIAAPTLANIKLETPEIIKQGSRYGENLK